MRIGILGLPQVGKTTIFELVARCGGGPGSGVGKGEAHPVAVKVPDPRLEELAALFHPKKVTPAVIEFQDFPPLRKGTGGVNSQLLGQLRTVDVLLEVVRCFEDPRVPHIEGSLDPRRDIRFVNDELVLSDLELIERRLERIELDWKRGRKEDKEREFPILELCREALAKGQPIRDLDFPAECRSLLRGYQLLTAKPLLLLLNLGEDQWPVRQEFHQCLSGEAGSRHTALMELCGKLELEICQLAEGERGDFMEDAGLGELGFDRLVRTCYRLLGLISFFTYMGEEVRAWSLPAGSTALKAAGAIHTDLEKGFIRAEVISFSELQAAGSLAAARKKGWLRLEGKDYLVQDGDVITIRFHV
jgi:GTP-binding protein YchF